MLRPGRRCAGPDADTEMTMMRVQFRCDPTLVDILPRPVAARAALPEWLRRMPATAPSETHGHDVRTVKQCPPFVDAMMHGFVIPLPCEVTVTDGQLSWDWPLPKLVTKEHTRSPISFHAPAQLAGSPLHNASCVAVKFHCFWTIELEAGWSLFATHPVNRADLPFRTLTGIVDSDSFHDVGIFFPALWVDPGFAGTLPAGTPVAQCFPVRREALDLAFAPFTPDEARRYADTGSAIKGEPGHYRKHHRARSSGGELGAQDRRIEDESPGARGDERMGDGAERA